MPAITEARELIDNEPNSWRAHVLGQLLSDLECDRPLHTPQIYQLDKADFDLALRCMNNARLRRGTLFGTQAQ